MATNMIYRYSSSKTRDRALSGMTIPTTAYTTIQPNVPVMFGTRSAVSLTADGAATVTRTTDLPLPLTSITYENGGVGNADAHATFAFDGTWEFAVTGGLTTTKSDTAVYITNAGALTLTSTNNTLYGYVDLPVGYSITAGTLPVRIGA